MTVDQLLATLARRRVTLTLDGDRLKYRAPTGALTADLLEAILKHRQTIITRLATKRNGKPNVKPDCIHVFWEHWVDTPPENGRIRTTCRLCGHFIGYRPAD